MGNFKSFGVSSISEMIDKIENRKDGDSGMFGTFFNKDII